MTDRTIGNTNHLADESDQVCRLFDAKAAVWSMKYAAEGPLTSRLAQFADALACYIPTGGSMLDIGCGTGDLSLAATRAGLAVTACDISPEMLRRAKNGDSDDVVKWVQLDPGWQQLPFESDSFNVIVASSVLEYISRPEIVLRECARVLHPGGLMLCTVPDITHPVRWVEWTLSMAVRTRLNRPTRSRWPRLDGYRTYLRISRNRHTAGWWRAMASGAGLLTVPHPMVWAPLRLLIFKRPLSTQEDS